MTNWTTKRVLIVEDVPMNMMMLDKVLQKCGVKADQASNGREAVKALEESAYDLIFMDCQMPEMDGFEATQKIRAIEKTQARKSSFIFALTGDEDPRIKEKCLAAGMNDYLTKPIKLGIIEGALKACAM